MLAGMERELAAHLLIVARAFAEAKNLSLTTVGRMAAWDGRFFVDIEEASRSFTARKYDEVLAFFSANWPDGGLPWPDGISRPDVGEWAKVEARARERAASKRGASSLAEAAP